MRKGEPAPSRKKPACSPILQKKPLSDSGVTVSSVTGTSSLPGTLRVRGASNVSNDSYLSVSGSDVLGLLEDDTSDGYPNGGSLDLLDDVDSSMSDPIKTKNAIAHLGAKIVKIRELIKEEQKLKEDNVNEYLRLASNADKQQVVRIKLVFEKKNSKSAEKVAQLQKKLENYQKKVRDIENYGISSHKQAKEVLRDVGQGIKGVVVNIKGAKETIVSKPREFASLIKNKFGSADNIRTLHHLDESQLSTADEGERSSHPGSETLPASFKYLSDDEASSITSGSGPSAGLGLHISPQPLLTHKDSNQMMLPANVERLLMEVHEYREMQNRLQETMESFKVQFSNDYTYLKQSIEEERYRFERLEEQINDLTELHQHEMTNLKQELISIEEKMEYQLDERTRDMQEMLETCQTRITKMELQAQQQQLISMEGVENANARMLITKLINVVLAVLAVLLVLISTITNVVSPFISSRFRLLTTVILVVAVILAYQHWPSLEALFNSIYTLLKLW